jgi:hypothetical protein
LENDTLSIFLILLSVIQFRHSKVSFLTLDKINGVSFSHVELSFSYLKISFSRFNRHFWVLKRHLPKHCFCTVISVETTLQFLLCVLAKSLYLSNFLIHYSSLHANNSVWTRNFRGKIPWRMKLTPRNLRLQWNRISEELTWKNS